MNIGEQIDNMRRLKIEIDRVNEVLRELQEERARLESQLLQQFDAAGVSKATGSLATVSISERVVPNVEDWDVFWEFIKDQNAPYLLERRPAAVAYREMLENMGEIPGTKPFIKRTLNMRKL
jgi:hypothetical protein